MDILTRIAEHTFSRNTEWQWVVAGFVALACTAVAASSEATTVGSLEPNRTSYSNCLCMS